MAMRRVLIGVGIALLVLFLLAVFAGAIMWGRGGYFMGPGMMRGFGYGGHMYGGMGFMGPLGWIVMILFWLLVVGGVVWLVTYLVRRGTRPTGTSEMTAPTSETPLDIAKRRYASGEISAEEFEHIKESLG